MNDGDSRFQVRFDGDRAGEGRISAGDLGTSIAALAELYHGVSRAVGVSRPARLEVESFQRGSVIVSFITPGDAWAVIDALGVHKDGLAALESVVGTIAKIVAEFGGGVVAAALFLPKIRKALAEQSEQRALAKAAEQRALAEGVRHATAEIQQDSELINQRRLLVALELEEREAAQEARAIKEGRLAGRETEAIAAYAASADGLIAAELFIRPLRTGQAARIALQPPTGRPVEITSEEVQRPSAEGVSFKQFEADEPPLETEETDVELRVITPQLLGTHSSWRFEDSHRKFTATVRDEEFLSATRRGEISFREPIKARVRRTMTRSGRPKYEVLRVYR